jgi:hypothetical protein
MTEYWFLFAYFALGALVASPFSAVTKSKPNVLYTFGAIILTIFIGLRYKVGGDWLTYQFMFRQAGPVDFLKTLSMGDPAYQAVNWASYQIGAGIWLVNSVCAAVFVWGLFRFCRTQPAPWLAVLLAIPYMVIVVAMGYTRQAVALGILMAGIAAFLRSASLPRFAIYVVAAALFHKTAVVVFPLVALGTQRNRLTNFLLVTAGGVLLYDVFLGDAMDNFVRNYVSAQYSSQGAFIRLLMNAVAAAAYWIVGRYLNFNVLEAKVWRNFSIASVICLGLLMVVPSSTAIDRVSLYLLPLQIAVIGRLPLIFKSRFFIIFVIIIYCFAIEFIWLNFGQFSKLWVPYRFYNLNV